MTLLTVIRVPPHSLFAEGTLRGIAALLCIIATAAVGDICVKTRARLGQNAR
ncbi:hypothetical protein SAMN05443245_5680 [Paraburkholderia fungorum]|uniref:Uncharacterized protein n=1 Tax=Paraburkholderia fungorum TaxID=134537 RepID=A0A1H1IU05_9BURK|nr:hypothetical protein SAMN05443245_5680 [Paraburkholderia fungorum]